MSLQDLIPKSLKKPKEGPDTGGPPPLKGTKPKVGDKIQFGGQMYLIRKITKKDMLLRPISKNGKAG